MQILNLQPVPDPGSGGNRTLALFDCRLTDDLRLTGLALCRRPDGSHIVASPKAYGVRTASFAPALVQRIVSAALAAYSTVGLTPDAIRQR